MDAARSLTAGEVALARKIFGNSIDYGAVQVLDQQCPFYFQPRQSAMTLSGKIYARDCYSADYAADGPDSRAFFIHEMTHVWQFQNKILNPIVDLIKLDLKGVFGKASSPYNFTLEAGKDLTEYPMERQGAIIADYYLMKHEGLTEDSYHCKNVADPAERQRLYENVLEKFLENPSYARQGRFFQPFRRWRNSSKMM